jgi:hypothetical protein
LGVYFSPVKILVEISPEYYDRLLNGISEASRMYAVLKNGVVMHYAEAGTAFRRIEILCEKFHAQMLVTVAEELCPEAVSQIEEAISRSRTLH